MKNTITKQGYLRVDETHRIHYRVHGDLRKPNIMYIHGGPGYQGIDEYVINFDLDKFSYICFDQRGCGRSLPFGSLKKNTTNHLNLDIEKLQNHLKINKSILMGDSWGNTLALLYAINFPLKVDGLLLCGIFLGTKKEIEWMFSPKELMFQKEFQKEYQKFIHPVKDSKFLLSSYHDLIKQKDKTAIKRWNNWEDFLGNKLEYQEKNRTDKINEKSDFSMALIESHYFKNNCFIEDNYIIDNIQYINHIPLYINQGFQDKLCGTQNAQRLARKHTKSSLNILRMPHYFICDDMEYENLNKGLDWLQKNKLILLNS